MRFRKIGILLFLLISLFSAALQAQEDTRETHKDLIREWVETGLNTGNFDLFDVHYSQEYVHHLNGEDLALDDYQTYLGVLRTAMPDFQASLEVLIAEQDWVASRVRFTGTFQNNWGDIPPTGEKLNWTVHTFHQLNGEGQIIEEWTAFDPLDLPLPSGTLPTVFASYIQAGANTPAVMSEPASVGNEALQLEGFSQFIELALNQGDLSALETYMAEEHLTHEPFGEFTRDEFGQVVAGFRATVPDLHVEIETTVVENDWLAARLIYTGTFSNDIVSESLIVPATHAPLRFVIHVFVRFNEQGIGVEDFKEYNRLGWLQQANLLP